jgi:hypothetical protein
LINNPPEFLDPKGPLTLGGYGGLAIPSSFHHPNIRFIRKKVYETIKPLLKKCFPNHLNVELLFARVCIRRVGTSTPKGSWHRDVCPDSLPGDIILGGWINLDPDGSPNQKFSCVPGTHTDKTNKTGFAKTNVKPSNPKTYEVPPGHVILFHQNILHEIKPQKASFESHRLYLGWRLTNSLRPLFDHTSVFINQSVPKLPSGQIPPMYAKLHWVNHKHLIDEITNRIKPEYIDPKTGKVFRELPWLEKYYPDYTCDEKIIMTPQPL